MYQLVIVDDEPDIVDGIINALDWEGFQIEIACATTDPQEALAACFCTPVDIVITDVSMPEINGLELIRRLKEVRSSVYAIILSAYDHFEYVRTALRYGAENYLLKPLDAETLSDTVSQILRQLEERETLQSMYGRSMLTFRSAFTAQWVKGYLSLSEIEEKASLLGINLTVESFTVVRFWSGDASNREMSLFFDTLLQQLPGHYTACFCFETPQCLIGVFSPLPSHSHPVSELVEQLTGNATMNGLSVTADIGTTVGTSGEVPDSYQAAERLWQVRTRGQHPAEDRRPLSPIVESVLSAIEKGDNRDISLKTLAARYKVSPSYLGTIFRQQTGMYFNDALAEARLTQAARLLRETDARVRDIVERTGFSSQTYFNRSFKRRFGLSPLSYRRGEVL